MDALIPDDGAFPANTTGEYLYLFSNEIVLPSQTQCTLEFIGSSTSTTSLL